MWTRIKERFRTSLTFSFSALWLSAVLVGCEHAEDQAESEERSRAVQHEVARSLRDRKLDLEIVRDYSDSPEERAFVQAWQEVLLGRFGIRLSVRYRHLEQPEAFWRCGTNRQRWKETAMGVSLREQDRLSRLYGEAVRQIDRKHGVGTWQEAREEARRIAAVEITTQ